MISFEKLETYFGRLRVREKPTKGGGLFLPSSLATVNLALEQLLKSKTFDSSRLFFDAGFGDGRILLLTAGVYGIPSAGAEYDEELAERAEYHIGEIRKLDTVRDKIAPITLAIGDFGTDETYSKVGIIFEDIATFYNYANHPYQIAEKIVRLSPRGTKFFYHGGRRDFEGLILEQRIGDKFHVYRK